jgi:hypothetical protein
VLSGADQRHLLQEDCMFELIALATAAGASGFAYLRSRDFVSGRLRYVDAVQRPSAPVIAGIITVAVATPVVWALPIVGGGTALLVGAAVGAGTRAGVNRIRRAPAGG